MTFKQCDEGSRLEKIMDKAIQERVDLQQTGTAEPREGAQKVETAAAEAEEAFRSHKHACSECEIPAA
jgi:hypothetical protein